MAILQGIYLICLLPPLLAIRYRLNSRLERAPYKFEESWLGRSFDERWSEFQNEVPLEKFQSHSFKDDTGYEQGPICQPSLEGPADSDNLAILLHGYTACPGMWYRLTPPLIKRGFRVMRPTLPGHGLKWIGKSTTALNVNANRTFDPDKADQEASSVTDQIETMPQNEEGYSDFASALGQLVEQFKAEHPSGTVVVMGHSLGGTVATEMALDYAHAIDRVLIANPLYGFSSPFAMPLLKMSPTIRLRQDWGAPCETIRATMLGGYCQFLTTHILAAGNYGIEVFHRVVGSNATTFSELVSLQMITTHNDGIINGDNVKTLMEKIGYKRYRDRKAQPGFCWWPEELSHNYLAPRNAPGRNFWWLPYVEHAMIKYMSDGDHIDLVKSHNDYGVSSCKNVPCGPCFEKQSEIASDALTVLPASHHKEEYRIANPYGEVVEAAKVQFSGVIGASIQDSKGPTQERQMFVELLALSESTRLLSVRRVQHGNVKEVYVIHSMEVSDSKCVLMSGSRLPGKEIYQQLPVAALNALAEKLGGGSAMTRIQVCEEMAFLEAVEASKGKQLMSKMVFDVTGGFPDIGLLDITEKFAPDLAAIRSIDGEQYRCCCQAAVYFEKAIPVHGVLCDLTREDAPKELSYKRGCGGLKGPGFHSWMNFKTRSKYNGYAHAGNCVVAHSLNYLSRLGIDF